MNEWRGHAIHDGGLPVGHAIHDGGLGLRLLFNGGYEIHFERVITKNKIFPCFSSRTASEVEHACCQGCPYRRNGLV